MNCRAGQRKNLALERENGGASFILELGRKFETRNNWTASSKLYRTHQPFRRFTTPATRCTLHISLIP